MAEGYVQEDSLVLPYVLERIGTLAKTEIPLYHWRVTEGSISRSAFGVRDFDYLQVSFCWAEFFAARGDAVQSDYFRKQFLQRTLYYYFKVADEKPDLMGAFAFHILRYKRLLPRYFWAKGLCVRERLAYVLFYIAPAAARKFFDQVYKGESL